MGEKQMSAKRLGYFTAGTVPTSAEAIEIARIKTLSAPAYAIEVLNAATAEMIDGKQTYDYVAGTPPTEYASDTKFGGDGKIDAAKPLAFGLFPATATLTTGQTLQLRAIKALGDNVDAITQSSVTASTLGTTYVSATTAKATVSAEGLVTFAAAGGSSVITATHTYASGKTVTATMTVTTA
jgi:hypothetical protein